MTKRFFLATIALTCGLAMTPTSTLAQGCPGISPFDSVPDDAGLQCLLDAGGTIALTPGGQGYLLEQGLRIGADNVHLTSTSGSARIVAAPNLRGMMLRMRDDVGRNGYSLSNLTIDGNKFNRLNNYAADCSTDYRERGISISLKGNGFVVHDVGFENTMCGSSLEVSGANFSVYNNTIVNSGLASQGGASQPWADGITLLQCINSSVTGNRIFEATDVGIVVGISTTQGCAVSRNLVRNTSAYAFAGIAIGGPSSHAASYVSDNVVESGLNKMGFGIWLGEGPWGFSGPTPFAGLVSGNEIRGAVVNLGIDNITGGTVRDNLLYGAQGNQGMNGCPWPAELTYGSIGSASIQPGGIHRSWINGCSPYRNAPPSARINSPNSGSVFDTSQNITFNVTASDPDTTASRVDFYVGTTLLHSDTSAPFSFAASAPLPAGTFDVTAIASDASGRGPTSNVVRVTVNQAPSVTISSPPNGAVIPVGSMVTITAATTGPITYVDFYAFITSTQSWLYLGRDNSAPFSATVGPVSFGDYPIGAIANGTYVTPIVTVYVR